jgi:hypothetical protein
MPRTHEDPGAGYPERPDPDEDTSAAESWASGENGEVELLDDGEPVDAVDIEDSWAPGEPPVGLPADEVLRVHALTASEPPADLLDVSDDALDLPVPDGDKSLEDQEENLEQLLPRTVLGGHDLETRYEELDPGNE